MPSVLKVLPVGDPGVKIRMLECICAGPEAKNLYNGRYRATVFDNKFITYEYHGREVQMEVWGNTGNEEFERIRKLFYRDTDIVLLVFKRSSKSSLENLQFKWVPEVLSQVPNATKVIVGWIDPDDEAPDPDLTEEFAESAFHSMGVEGRIYISDPSKARDILERSLHIHYSGLLAPLWYVFENNFSFGLIWHTFDFFLPSFRLLLHDGIYKYMKDNGYCRSSLVLFFYTLISIFLVPSVLIICGLYRIIDRIYICFNSCCSDKIFLYFGAILVFFFIPILLIPIIYIAIMHVMLFLILTFFCKHVL